MSEGVDQNFLQGDPSVETPSGGLSTCEKPEQAIDQCKPDSWPSGREQRMSYQDLLDPVQIGFAARQPGLVRGSDGERHGR